MPRDDVAAHLVGESEAGTTIEKYPTASGSLMIRWRVMEIRGITKTDFDRVVSVFDEWWGGPSSDRAHPVFFYELGAHALVAEEDGEMVGFLLGFVAPVEPPVAYVHLVGIHPERRRRGIGKTLYRRFAERCRATGARTLKSIASPRHRVALGFHQSLGFECIEDENYAGPGRARVVFTKQL